MDDLSQQVASLKDLLVSNQNLAEECFSKASMDHSPKLQSAEISTVGPEANQTSASRDHVKHSLSLEEDTNGPVQTVQRECVMSLDITQYELQMLEMQARQEETEEQSILAFEVQVLRILFFFVDVDFLQNLKSFVLWGLMAQLSSSV